MRLPSKHTHFLLCDLGWCACWSANWLPYTKSKERMREEDHSGLVGGRFHKQGDLGMRLVFCHHKTSRSLPMPTRVLEVYVEPSLGSAGYTAHMLSLAQCCLKAAFFKIAPTVGKVDRVHIPRQGRGWGGSDCLSQLGGQLTSSHLHLMTSLNNGMKAVSKAEIMHPGQTAKDFGWVTLLLC